MMKGRICRSRKRFFFNTRDLTQIINQNIKQFCTIYERKDITTVLTIFRKDRWTSLMERSREYTDVLDCAEPATRSIYTIKVVSDQYSIIRTLSCLGKLPYCAN